MDTGLIPEKILSIINYRRLLEVVKLSVDIDLYSYMGTPVSLDVLSEKTGLDRQFMEYLLNALLSFGFVEKIGGDLYLSNRESAQYLDSKSPAYMGREIFSDFEISMLLQNYVKGGSVSPVIDKGHWSPERLKRIASVSLLGGVQTTLEHVDLAGRGKLLDIGGGLGLYSIFFTKKYPGLTASIVELPQIAEVAREYVKKYGAEGEVNVIAADYNDLKPREQYDVVFLSNVVASVEELDKLLSLSREFLVKGGIVLLRNFVVDACTDEWSTIILLERYARRGRKGFSSGELADAMKKSGLSDIRIISLSDSVAVLQGKKDNGVI